MRTRAKSRSTGPADWFAPATKTVMKPAAAATDPTLFETKSTAGKLSPRAERCLTADHGESAAKYLFKLSHDVILSLDRMGTSSASISVGFSSAVTRNQNCTERTF